MPTSSLPIFSSHGVEDDLTGSPRMEPMIKLTRLNGPSFVLNCDLIERIEATPDTVVTLIDGDRYLVTESVDEVVEKVRRHRATVLAISQQVEGTPSPGLRVVPNDHLTTT
jgi:flagellar protein FlbD